MKRQLCHRIAGPERVLGVAMLGPRLEAEIRRSQNDTQQVDRDLALDGLALTPEANDRLLSAVRRLTNRQRTNGRQVALVVAADLRRRLRNHLAGNNIQLPVIAPHEIANEVPTFPLELVEDDNRGGHGAYAQSAARGHVVLPAAE
jgi:type III secretion protein V